MGRPRKTARKGRMSKAEKRLLEGVDPSVDAGEAAKGLALAFNRTPEALKKAIIDVRAGLVEKAERTSEILMESMELALETNQPAISGRLALDVLDRLSEDGQRVFDPPVKAPEGPVGPSILVQVALPLGLGGFKPSALKELPSIEVVEGEVAETPAADHPALTNNN